MRLGDLPSTIHYYARPAGGLLHFLLLLIDEKAYLG